MDANTQQQIFEAMRLICSVKVFSAASLI